MDTISQQEPFADGQSESEIKQRISEKLHVRMAALQKLRPMPKFNRNRPPDVIILVDNAAVLFEPQNWLAAEWLYDRCNLSLETAQLGDRISVHPCQWEKIVSELRNAGFDVLC